MSHTFRLRGTADGTWLAVRVSSLMESLRAVDLKSLPPVERQRFADQCRRLLPYAEEAPALPKSSGVLADLRRGLRSENAA